MRKFTAVRLMGEEERRIENVSIIDDNNNVINQQLYQGGNVASDSHYTYDENNLLIESTERTTEGGVTKIKYTYDDEGELIAFQRFFGDDLFKEEKIVTEGNIKTKSVFQEGELQEKVVETENEDGTETTEMYDAEGKLTQKIVIADLPGGLVETKYFDEENKLINLVLEKYDENDEMIERKEFDENQKLSKVEEFKIENGLIVKHIVKTILNREIVEFHTKYEYDANENEVKKEVCNPNGDVINVHERTFNEQNEMIEEVFENLSGNINYGTSYHKVIEIEEIS